jgi:replicative DNA helicase
MSSYSFNATFQQKILSLLVRDDGFLLGYREVIKPFYFENPVHVDVCRIITEYFDNYRSLPDLSTMTELIEFGIAKKLERAKKPEEIRAAYMKTVDSIYEMEMTDLEFVKDKTVEFAKHQALKDAILQSVDFLDENKYDEIQESVKKALEVGQNAANLGTFYFDNIEERILSYQEDTINGTVSTGSRDLDNCLNGGLGAGELGVIIAPPNVGKTLRLINLGKAALYQKKWVFHYSLEMDEKTIAKRYDACFTGRDIQSVADSPKKLQTQLGNVKKVAGGNLVIKSYPTKTATINDLKSHLTMVKAKFGIKPGLIIVDYGMILSSRQGYNDKRHEVASCYEDLRALGQEEGCPVWSAAQTNRGGLSKKTVTIEDLAEAFEMAAIADVMVALCQTPEEYEDDALREFGAKCRNSKKYWTLEKTINYNTMQVIDVENLNT